MRPKEGTYGEFYSNYVLLVPESNLFEAFKNLQATSSSFWSSISEEQANYRYAEGKWSIKELLQHIIDTERIFAYRALAFARGESIALPGYDENLYTENCLADNRAYSDILAELEVVRKSTRELFKSFDDSVLDNLGNASNSPLSVKAIGFILVGHELHHINVAKERYLKSCD